MSHIIGDVGKIAVSTDGITYIDLGGVTSVDQDITNDAVDTTDFDSLGWKEKLYGNSEASLSITMNYDEVDAGQAILVAAAVGKTGLYFRYRPEELATKDQFIFQGVLTSLSDGSPQGDKVEMTADVESNGVVAKSAQ